MKQLIEEIGEKMEINNGSIDEIISWDRPVVTSGSDSAREVYIKNFGVREIQPPINIILLKNILSYQYLTNLHTIANRNAYVMLLILQFSPF